jgi:hypothetical protein
LFPILGWIPDVVELRLSTPDLQILEYESQPDIGSLDIIGMLLSRRQQGIERKVARLREVRLGLQVPSKRQ